MHYFDLSPLIDDNVIHDHFLQDFSSSCMMPSMTPLSSASCILANLCISRDEESPENYLNYSRCLFWSYR